MSSPRPGSGSDRGHAADREPRGRDRRPYRVLPAGRRTGTPSSCPTSSTTTGTPEAGYVTEAVQLLVDHLFATKKKHRIHLVIVPENAASRRIAEKCGFTLEGTVRGAFFNDGRNQDVLLYSLAAHRSTPVARLTRVHGRLAIVDDDRELLARAEQALTEIKVNHGLSEHHAAVLAALRIRLKGSDNKSLEEMLSAADDPSPDILAEKLAEAEQAPKRSLDDLLAKEPEQAQRPSVTRPGVEG